MVRRNFAAEGRVTQHLKDVHLMREQAARVKQELPLLCVHEDVLEACVRHGEGELDNSIVIEEIRRAGIYRQRGQAFAVLTPLQSVGVMGDGRTYANFVAVRAVTTSFPALS